jgi:cell division protein FtsI/penicillin-binding protein 2
MVTANRTCLPENRLAALWVVFVVWAALVLFQLTRVMVFDRTKHLVAAPPESGWKTEIVPGGRGRILDSRGRPLAWSTRHFRLRWHVPRDPHDAEDAWTILSTAIKPAPQWNPDRIRLFLDQEIILCHNISSQEFTNLANLAPSNVEFRVESYSKRHRIAPRTLRERLGTTVFQNGTEVGVSGFEKRYDELLRANPGVIRVFVAESGEKIRGTRETIRHVRPGYDVYAPFTLRYPVEQ